MLAEQHSNVFEYSIKAHPTEYAGVRFRSRLEARYAAFFDLLGWKWEYEPVDLKGWTPDFLVKVPCTCGSCPSIHTLMVEVKPYQNIHQFDKHRYALFSDDNGMSFAAFGNNPDVSRWKAQKGHIGFYTISSLVTNWEFAWKKAGNTVQFMSAKPAESDLKEELITPTIAAEYLRLNTSNRPLNQRLIWQYANDMLRGGWTLGESMICFSTKGELLNGQHRLHACVQSQTSFRTVVKRNMPEDSFKNMDTGKNRSLSYRTGISRDEIAVYRVGIFLWRCRRAVTYEDIKTSVPSPLVDALKELLSYCGTLTRKFSSSTVRLSASLLMILHPESKQYIKEQYRALVLGHFDDMSPHSKSFYKRWADGKTAAARGDDAMRCVEAFRCLDPRYQDFKLFRITNDSREDLKEALKTVFGNPQQSISMYTPPKDKTLF